MPPNTKERWHYHDKAQQFFYILSGIASFELEDQMIEVESGTGFQVLPGIKHRIRNLQANDLEFLVISQPTTKGDRVEEE